MSSDFRKVLVFLGSLGLIVAALIVVLKTGQPALERTEQAANVVLTLDAPSPEPAQEGASIGHVDVSPANLQTEGNPASARRVENPYPFPPQSFSLVHEKTRAALVNIFCTTNSGGVFQSISGSGVIIDPRGVILTNAHVAQYVLLAQSGRTSLSCQVRYGAPAWPLWETEVLYMPPIWVKEHATDITEADPTGTGEHDYALLHITRSIGDPSGRITDVPFIPLDSREAIAFPSDLVLAASYPSEFIGSTATESRLYPISSTAPVEELLTFGTDFADLISVGGILGAQSGSSGGPVVNSWGYLVGIITTTSEGATTAERELRALTLSYINRDLFAQTGSGLAEILNGNIAAKAREFRTKQAPTLVEALISAISRR